MPRPLSLIADLARLPYALLIWNWRKSAYRLRGRRGRCPCQHPSDSGAAVETACDACVEWAKPERFRWVCPLLVPGEHGWHCAVHAEDVRPFWGRALGIFAGLGLALYLSGVSAVFVTFRATGADGLAWTDVAWPARWGQMAKARSRYFAVRTARLMQEGDFVAAELSLLSSLEVDPDNYEARLFLAQFRQYQQRFIESDALFRGLMEQAPERAAQTALAWHDSLLMRQRFPELAELSLRMGAMGTESAASWARSGLLAIRHGQAVGTVLARNAEFLSKLPPAAGALFYAEELRQRGANEDSLQLLREAWSAPLVPFLVAEYVEQFIRLGERDRAEAFLRVHQPILAPFDRVMLRMRIDQASRDTALVRLEFEALLQFEITRTALERLVAWLVEHPDRQSFARLDQVMRDPKQQAVVAGAEMWVAALAVGDEAAVEYWAKFCLNRFRIRLPVIHALDFRSTAMSDIASVPRVISVGRLPREVIFALVRRASVAKAPAGPGPGRRDGGGPEVRPVNPPGKASP